MENTALHKFRQKQREEKKASPKAQIPDKKENVPPQAEAQPPKEPAQIKENPEEQKASEQRAPVASIVQPPALIPEQQAEQPAGPPSIESIRGELQQQYPNGLGYQLAPYEPDLGIENHLAVEHLIADKKTKEKAQFFCCSICSMVVIDPVECAKCNTTYCRACLEPWKERGGHCPKRCSGGEVRILELHRYAKMDLQHLVFKCRNERCSEQAEYEEALSHLLNCEERFRPCANGCGSGIMRRDQRYHDYMQCAAFKLTCPRCELPQGCPNDQQNLAKHDCMEALKTRVRELEGPRAMVGTCDEYVEGYDLTKNRCQDCDVQLRKMHKKPAGYDGSARCDVCHTVGLENYAFFFHCVDCANFDLCFGCSLSLQNKVPFHGTTVQLPALGTNVRPALMMEQDDWDESEAEEPLECMRGRDCLMAARSGHIADHVHYEDDRHRKICVYCVLAQVDN